ncbi:MAG: ABC transporter ATP-binding protein [Chitinophagaceae bacterium]|jgi:ABC-2 type transport system ATP-binding protein
MPSTVETPPLLEVSGLTKTYGSFKAVDDLSFTVFPGDVFGFLGQNGAGKSTTIRMLLTLIRPNAGQIRVFGMDLQQHRREVLSRVGAVIEKPDLYGYLTGQENLSLFARMSGKGITKDRIQETLELVGLQKRAGDRVKTYSQGMKQRLGIACALVHDPDLIILDEPTNGLDPQGIADIRNLVLSLSREQGKTFLISSHLLAEVELMANRMIIIDRGKKIVEGSVRELVDPQDRELHLEAEDDGFAVACIEKTRWADQLMRDQLPQVVLRMANAEIPALVDALVAEGVRIQALRPVNRLEAYFLSLTHA